jgi:hypothetical protein
MLLFPVQ